MNKTKSADDTKERESDDKTIVVASKFDSKTNSKDKNGGRRGDKQTINHFYCALYKTNMRKFQSY